MCWYSSLAASKFTLSGNQSSDAVSSPSTNLTDQGPLTSLTLMVVPAAAGAVQVTVRPEATAAHVLEKVCRLCQLGSPTSYSLLHRDMDHAIPPHQLVADFPHTSELILVERNSLRRQDSLARHAHGPVPEQPKYKNAMDLISSYKARICGSHPRPTRSIAAIISPWADTNEFLPWMANGCTLCSYGDTDF